MPTFYGAVDLSKNELRNAVVQNLGAAPSSPVKFQIYGNTSDNNLYFYDGTAWVSCRSAGALTPANAVTTSSPGDGSTVGVSTNYARQDHQHGRNDNYGTVVAQTTFGLASSNGVGVNIARYDHAHGTPTHVAADHSAIPLSALAVPTASVNFNNQLATNVATPVSGTDGANKNYVDNTIQGLDAKVSVRATTSGGIGTLAGGAPSTLDGVTLAANDRVLVKDQATPAQNGIYVVTTLGTGSNGSWTRATDMDTWTEVPAAYTWVESGTTWADTGWVCTSDPGGTLGTTAITWSQFNGAGAITAGAGLTKTGSSIDVVTGDTSLIVNADEMHVNTAVMATVASLASYAKKFAAALTGTASPETVTHNLNTRDISLTVYNGSTPYTAVEVDWDAATVNTATVRYNPNLGAGYRVVVVG